MRKAEIQEAVELRMAELGYRPGYYGWCKPGWLEVWDGKAERIKINLPASRRMDADLLQVRLAEIKRAGRPRAAGVRMAGHKGERWKQTDLVDWIANAR